MGEGLKPEFEQAPDRVDRGGSWFGGPSLARVALRYDHDPSDRNLNLGFRLVREDV